MQKIQVNFLSALSADKRRKELRVALTPKKLYSVFFPFTFWDNIHYIGNITTVITKGLWNRLDKVIFKPTTPREREKKERVEEELEKSEGSSRLSTRLALVDIELWCCIRLPSTNHLDVHHGCSSIRHVGSPTSSRGMSGVSVSFL